MRTLRSSFALVFLGLLTVLPVMAQLPPLIPREVLFGNPERTSPRLSPDGQRISWLAPDTNAVLQVWVKTIGKDDDRIVTADKKRGIRNHLWAEDNRTLLYLQDSDGDENFHVYGVDLESGNVRDFTPFQGVRAGVESKKPRFPNEVLVSMNARNREVFDVYRLNLQTGALVLDTENPGDVVGWLTDGDFQVRGAQVTTPDGGTEIRVRDDAKSPWRSWIKVGPAEILRLRGGRTPCPLIPEGGAPNCVAPYRKASRVPPGSSTSAAGLKWVAEGPRPRRILASYSPGRERR